MPASPPSAAAPSPSEPTELLEPVVDVEVDVAVAVVVAPASAMGMAGGAASVAFSSPLAPVEGLLSSSAIVDSWPSPVPVDPEPVVPSSVLASTFADVPVPCSDSIKAWLSSAAVDPTSVVIPSARLASTLLPSCGTLASRRPPERLGRDPLAPSPRLASTLASGEELLSFSVCVASSTAFDVTDGELLAPSGVFASPLAFVTEEASSSGADELPTHATAARESAQASKKGIRFIAQTLLPGPSS
ncbi:MAG: hypothetical protein ABSF69_18205 [Polyangiaceae bacterium]